MSVRIDKEAEASFMVVIPSHDWLLATRLGRCDKTILRRSKRKVYHEQLPVRQAEMAATSYSEQGTGVWQAGGLCQDTRIQHV